MDGATLADLRWRVLGWRPADAAAWCGVTERTLRRWETDGPPTVAARALRLAAGDLGAFSAAWSGWWLGADRLHCVHAPGPGWGPGDVLAGPWLHARIRVLERELQRARDQRGGGVSSASMR